MIPLWPNQSVLHCSIPYATTESALHGRHVELVIPVIAVCAACRKAVCCRSSVGMTRPSCLNAIMPARAGERAGTEWCKTDCGNMFNPDAFWCSAVRHAECECAECKNEQFNYWQHVVCVCVSLGYDCKSFALLKWAGVWELCRIFLKEPSYASKAYKVLLSLKRKTTHPQHGCYLIKKGKKKKTIYFKINV